MQTQQLSQQLPQQHLHRFGLTLLPVFLRPILPMLLLLFVTTACLATEPVISDALAQPVDRTAGSDKAEQLIADTQCNVDTSGASAKWLASQADLDMLYRQIQADIIGNKQTGAPVVDFARNVVLFVSMGQHFTGGYSVKLADESVQLANGVATVRVKWRVPSAGAMLMQVLTSPCVVIKMPAGDYRQIRVMDQDGTLRASANFPSR